MLAIEIPSRLTPQAKHILLDYNGTIATDGLLLPDLPERLFALQRFCTVRVLTADTYGTIQAQCAPPSARRRS
jgi:soluble P-type ATPase